MASDSPRTDAGAGADSIGFVTDPALVPLARVQEGTMYFGSRREPARLRIAYDRATAEHAWNEELPDNLGSGTSTETGVYGSLDDVDFDRQAVIVWSYGEANCSGWLAGIDTVDGRVRVELGEAEGDCTYGFYPYRMLLAVDRDRLPTPDELPISEIEGVAGRGWVSEFRSSDPKNRSPRVDPAITALAKAPMWRQAVSWGLDGLIEIAFDVETAQRAWSENVPADLEPSDIVGEAGLFGALDDVDFQRRALVVASLNGSGTCPSWITDVDTLADGRLRIEKVSFGDVCTSDLRPYVLVLAIDRDHLPDPASLPTEVVDRYNEIPVDSYPARVTKE